MVIHGANLHLIKYNCQMNEYGSEQVAGLLREHRWELTADETEADLILLNTSAIREKAEDKVFSELGKGIFPEESWSAGGRGDPSGHRQ
jgi:tRNA A37 methylthiotransferase MiaB